MTELSGTTSIERFEPPSWPIDLPEVSEVLHAMAADGSWGRYDGPHCDALRDALREFHQADHVVLCSSGTSAVELALRAVPIQAGDEVVMCAYDFKANFINVVLLGGVPVLVDTKPGSPMIDADQIKAASTSRTKAILISHLHGTFAEIADIRALADELGVALIEDACQSTGAIIGARRAGTWGHVGILSFGGSKLLTCGRGGAVISNDSAMIQRIRLYTQRGNEAYPLSEMQAAVLLPQLRQLDEFNRQRLHHARRFAAALHTTGDPSHRYLSAIVDIVAMDDDVTHSTRPVFYKLAILCDEQLSEKGRERLCQQAREFGIPIDPAFPALHLIHSRKRFRASDDLQHATELHDRLIGLHHTALLLPETEIDRMARVLVELAAKLA